MTRSHALSAFLYGGALLLAHAGAQAGWVTISNAGSPVLSTCNPKPSSSTLSTCKVTGLPGSAAIPGYILVPGKPSRTTNIVVSGDTGSATVGVLYDRVWCLSSNGTSCNSTNTYIFGTRANLNTNAGWNSDGETFEINDYFRAVRTSATVEISYFMGTVDNGTNADTAKAYKYLEYSGRTKQGLGEYATSPNGLNPLRNNAWINFRADTNALDPDGENSPWSPWMFARTTCSSIGTNTSKVRVHQGGEEGQSDIEFITTGYVCN